MKKTIIGLFLLGFIYQSYAQDVLFEEKLKKEEVPATIIESVDQNFPAYEVEEFSAIPIDIIENDVVVDRNITSKDDYNTYQVTLKGKNVQLVATYNKAGKLLSTVEHGKNMIIPNDIIKSIENSYPGWKIKGDSFKMVNNTGAKKRERYKIILEKGNKKKRVYTSDNGVILEF
jgi:outer membrane lipoprotein-sorting protein